MPSRTITMNLLSFLLLTTTLLTHAAPTPQTFADLAANGGDSSDSGEAGQEGHPSCTPELTAANMPCALPLDQQTAYWGRPQQQQQQQQPSQDQQGQQQGQGQKEKNKRGPRAEDDTSFDTDQFGQEGSYPDPDSSISDSSTSDSSSTAIVAGDSTTNGYPFCNDISDPVDNGIPCAPSTE